MRSIVAGSKSRGKLDFLPGRCAGPCQGGAQIGITAVTGNVRIVFPQEEVEPRARLQGNLPAVGQAECAGRLQIRGVKAALQGAATPVRLMLSTKLQVKLEVPVVNHVGIIKERGRFVAGVKKSWILAEDRPKRGLRVAKIKMGKWIPTGFAVEEFVLQAELKLRCGSCAENEIDRFVEIQMTPEEVPHLNIRRCIGDDRRRQ